MQDKLTELTLDDFEKLIGQKLIVIFRDKTERSVVITKVERGITYKVSARVPFSCIFETSDDFQPHPQGIYEIIHPDHGHLNLFIVPIGPGASGMQYEFIFS